VGRTLLLAPSAVEGSDAFDLDLDFAEGRPGRVQQRGRAALQRRDDCVGWSRPSGLPERCTSGMKPASAAGAKKRE
jgi:hypothetical protein